MRSLKDISFTTLLIIGIFLCIYRINNVSNKEISWDVLGYYMPLPATFIHNDPMLNNIEWLEKVNKEKDLTGTLYMVSTNDEGEPIYFFLLGMSLFYLPFFLAGNLSAFILGLPMDGFSSPYQYALVIGAVIYTIIGLIYLRKILKLYFSEKIITIILLVTVFSTNYIHHLTLKNLETVNILFMMISIVIWFTIKWHKDQKLKYLLPIGISITLIGLVKPSEVVIIIIPLLWNVFSLETLGKKIILIIQNKKQFLISIGICILIASPQIIYWYIKTGSPFYDSYKNPGVGLDIFAPHIMDTLISYRKGWLLYTPIMFFYLFGFPIMFKKNKKILFAISTYFIVTFYIISSWSEWWYGAGFSNRPLIATYPILAISFGYFLSYIEKKGTAIKITVLSLTIFFTVLNQFQWWQLKNFILEPYRTTKEYYWATFFKSYSSEEDKKLLLIERSFNNEINFDNKESYQIVWSETINFDSINKANYTIDSSVNEFLELNEAQTYAITKDIKYKNLTDNDHIYINVSFDLRFPKDFNDTWPCMVITMDRKEGNYGYFAPEIRPDSTINEWVKYNFIYLTPIIRNHEDILKYFIWKRGSQSFDVDNFKVEVFEKKPLY